MRTDPRVVRSRAAILEACAALIAEEGFSGVSIEAVAARSGAAKTTIYRHWPSREALLADAFRLCADEPPPAPDTGSLREDLVTLLGGLAACLADADSCSALRSLADAATREPGLRQVHAAFVAERRRPLAEMLERAVGRGELPAGLDRDLAISLLAGPLFYRAMVSRETIDRAFIAAVVDAALAGLGAP